MEIEEMKLSKNEGTPDRIIRVLLGVVLGAALIAGVATGPLAYVGLIVAALLLVTGVTGFCPLYAVLGLRTTPASRR
jgi:Inner membrane protein YgaP-like, transmembrane domain